VEQKLVFAKDVGDAGFWLVTPSMFWHCFQVSKMACVQ